MIRKPAKRRPSKRSLKRPSKKSYKRRPTKRPSKRPTKRPSKRPSKKSSKRPSKRPSKKIQKTVTSGLASARVGAKTKMNKVFSFNTIEELKSLLNNVDKNVTVATITHNAYGGQTSFDVCFEGPSGRDTIKLDITDSDAEENPDKFDYYADNWKDFFKVIFKFIKGTAVKKLYLLTNDEDESTDCIDKDMFEVLNYKGVPEVYVTFRGNFMFFDAKRIVPKVLQDKLFVKDKGTDWIKWRPEFYAKDDDEDAERVVQYAKDTYNYEIPY
jgi:hypothetical protein